MMEAKQFYIKQISPLVAKTFSCKWSQDDRLSVVTKDLVHIFEIKPAPYQAHPIIDLSRTFINSPKVLPGEFYAKEVLQRIFDWKKDDVYTFLSNETHLPCLPKSEILKAEINNVFWSPKGLLHPQKCLLALLTNAGNIEIAVQIEKNWLSIYELSKDWYNIIKDDFQSLKESVNVGPECYKEQLNRLCVTDATWSSLYHQKNNVKFSYLVTAHRNENIVIWKVHRVLVNSVHADSSLNVEFKFRKKLTDNSNRITTMLWVDIDHDKYLLVIGYQNGQIGVLNLQEFEGGLTGSYSICFSDDNGVSVNHMELLQQTNKQLELVAVKENFLLILTMDNSGQQLLAEFVIAEFSITGVSVIDSNKILMVSQDAKISLVQKLPNQEEFTCVLVKSDIAKDALQYLGLASSQSKLLHVLSNSPSVMYDHLNNREPTNLCFFTLQELQSQDVVKRLYENKEQSLANSWDYLDWIKIDALKRGGLPTMKRKINNLDYMSLHELKVTYWFLNIRETVKKKISTDEDYSPPKEIELAKTYIFFYSASSYLEVLAQQGTLTDTQKLSMSLVRNHLDIWYAGEEDEAETPLSATIKYILEVTSAFDLIQQEKCSFCDTVITEPWASACSQGHKLPRCALTRLQVTCTNYQTCPICQEVYHPCLDDEMSEVKCIYCDVPVVYKNLNVDPKLLASERNLSKDKLCIGNQKDKNKDKDEGDDDD